MQIGVVATATIEDTEETTLERWIPDLDPAPAIAVKEANTHHSTERRVHCRRKSGTVLFWGCFNHLVGNFHTRLLHSFFIILVSGGHVRVPRRFISAFFRRKNK